VQKKNLTYLYLAGASGVWLYLMLRAWLIPPVHDEAATFFHYINHGEYWPGKALWDANNHILNSFLSKYAVKVFGISAFTIRLANLMFFPVYAWFIYKFSTQLKTPRAQFLLLLSGLTIHGFVEYFAYARGYGMSMALLTGALYYSYRFFSVKNIRLLAAAVIFYGLATLANLTLQNTSLMFLGMAALFLFVEKFNAKQRIMGMAYVCVGLLALWPLINLSLEMKKDGLLYYAQDEDFWTAVISSFTQMFFDSKSYTLHLFWFAWFGLFVWLTATFLPKLRAASCEDRARIIFPLFFFGNLAGIFAMHYAMGVNFPSDRTGMHLVLYLFLGCVFLADLGKPRQQFAVLVPILVFFAQFSLGANVSYSTYWKGEHLPQRFWKRIYDESESGRYVKNPTVGGYRLRNLVWAWHNFKRGGTLQNMQYLDYYTGFEDYQIFSAGDYAKHRHVYDSLDTDEYSNVTLTRRKTFLRTQAYWDTTGITTPENYNGEYFNLFETFVPDSFLNKTWQVEADIKLYSLLTPPKIHFVTSFMDADGNTLDYETSPLDWRKKEYRPEDPAPVNIKIWWYKVPPETKRIVVYLWNVDKDAYTLQKGDVRILRVH